MKRGFVLCLILAMFVTVLAPSLYADQPTPSEQAALAAYRQGKFSQAVRLYTKALAETDNPGHRAQLQVRIAWTLFALGRRENVATHLRAALLEDPGLTLVPDYYTQEFLQLFDRIKKEVASSPAAGPSPPPPDLEATIDSIQQRLQSGSDLSGALADVKNLRQVYPTDGRLLPLEIAILRKMGRSDEAAQLQQSMNATAGGGRSAPAPQMEGISALSVPELVLRANRLLDQGDVTTSLKLLRKAVDRQPANVAALELLAEAAIRAGHWDEAEFALKSALSYQQDNLELQLRLGETYLAMGKLSAARDVFRQLSDAHPHSDRAWASLGLLDARMRQDDRAIKELARALEENPLLPEAQLAYGELLLAKGHARKALAAFQSAANLLEDDPQLEARTGQALLALDRTADALPRLEAAIQQKFNPPDVVAALALALIRSGLDAKAQRLLKNTTITDADGRRILDGLLMLHQRHLGRALAAFQAQAAKKPNDPAALDLVGVTLYRMSRFADAATLFDRAHELSPKDSAIAANLERARAAAAAAALEAAAVPIPAAPPR
ncbi:MAG: tetratricopeptide repeat protein [Acidobacteria bacterium]|nr:tetratricopeptide repeat protein [Acidobacteriota bacterium]